MIVGLAGRKYAGKDTAAAVFMERGFVHLKMAGALKEMLYTLLDYQGVDGETCTRMIEGDLKEVPTPYLGGHSPRYAMQTLGTEWGRELMGPNFWRDIFASAAAQYQNVICSDVRFPNEVEVLDFTILIKRGAGGETDVHASEALIDLLPHDAEVNNLSDSVEQYQNAVRALIALESLTGAPAGRVDIKEDK